MSNPSGFKRSEIPVQPEVASEETASQEIFTIDDQSTRKNEVKDYHFKKIHRAGEGSYAYTKKKYGPLAATDPDRKTKDQKAGRFRISPILRSPLSIDIEEKKMIEKQVAEELRAMKEKATREGFKKGQEDVYKKGYEEAYQKLTKEGQERLSRIDTLLNEMEHAKEEIFQSNEKFIIEMINQIAQKVILRELETDQDYLLRLSKDIIEKIGVRENVLIRINPKDVESIELLRAGLVEKLGEFKNLQVETSEKVKLGGCLIDTEWNAIDARIKTQLEKIEETLTSRSKVVKSGVIKSQVAQIEEEAKTDSKDAQEKFKSDTSDSDGGADEGAA